MIAWVRAATLCLAVAAMPGAPDAQTAALGVLLVDRERVLRESAPARTLAEDERRAQLSHMDELERLRASLEAEEAEIAALREAGDPAAFDARVAAFNTEVRDARRLSQQKGEALRARFAEARRRLAAALQPVLEQMLLETGALLVVDARNVLAARQGADVTDEVIRRLDAAAAASPHMGPLQIDGERGASPPPSGENDGG